MTTNDTTQAGQTDRRGRHEGLGRRRNGFALVEVLVVGLTAIVGLALGLPMVMTLDDISVQTAADEFALAHRAARSAAVLHGGTGQVRIDAEGGRFWAELRTVVNGEVFVVALGPIVDVSDSEIRLDADADLFCYGATGMAVEEPGCAPDGFGEISFSAAGESTVTLTATAAGMLLR